MALVEPFMNKYAKLSGSTDFELTADTGEAFLVKDIYVDSPANNYINVSVDKTSIIMLRCGGGLGSHCAFPQPLGKHSHSLTQSDTELSGSVEYPKLVDAFGNDTDHFAVVREQNQSAVTLGDAVGTPRETCVSETLLSYLARKGLWTGIPVAEGQQLVIREYGTNTQSAHVLVTYEVYEPGDISKDMPNGTDSTEYLYINYADTGAPVTGTAENLIENINILPEYINFPVGKDVPAKTEIDLLGIVASAVIDYDGDKDWTRTKYLKMVRGRKTLFDEDLNGLLMLGVEPSNASKGTYVGKGLSMVGNYSTEDGKEPFLLPTPLTFIAGEEFNVFILTEQSDNPGSIGQEYLEVGFIQRVRIVG